MLVEKFLFDIGWWLDEEKERERERERLARDKGSEAGSVRASNRLPASTGSTLGR